MALPPQAVVVQRLHQRDQGPRRPTEMRPRIDADSTAREKAGGIEVGEAPAVLAFKTRASVRGLMCRSEHEFLENQRRGRVPGEADLRNIELKASFRILHL